MLLRGHMNHPAAVATVRDGAEGARGARGAKVSARAVVRLAQRVLRKEQWGSFEITASCDSVSVRVHRATTSTEAARPDSSAPSGAQKTGTGTAQRMSRKRLKSIRRQRHGCLSRLATTGKITRWRMVAPFWWWYFRTRQSSEPPAGHDGADVEMEEGGASVPPGSEGPPRPEGDSSPLHAPKRARKPADAGIRKGFLN